jgi:hypothetical protein
VVACRFKCPWVATSRATSPSCAATTRTGISSGLLIRKRNAASVFRARLSPPPVIRWRAERRPDTGLVSSDAAGLEATWEGDVESAGKVLAAPVALDHGATPV